MQEDVTLFVLSDDVDEAQLLSGLRGHVPLSNSGTRTCDRRYFDSFDRLILDQGAVVYAEKCPRLERFVWQDVKTGAVRFRLTGSFDPTWPNDLPPGPLRDALSRVLELRALMRQLDVRLRRRSFRKLNDEKKTVVRIHLETIETRRPDTGATGASSVRTLRVVPLRGYAEQASDVRSWLADRLGEPVEFGQVFEAMFRSVGREPGDTSSKFALSLDPAERTDRAVRRVLLALLDTVELNEEGVRRGIDSEFLHDFRVAIRRTRSVLGQFKKVLPPLELSHFRGEFKWLGQATGPLRDLDVYVIRLSDYRNWLPESVRNDLGPLERFLLEQQADEQRRLARSLTTKRYRALLRTWRTFLEAEPPEPAPSEDALKPILPVAAALTWRMYRKVLRQGNAILEDPASPPEALHELRITCKKLRYLMELFRSLYPSDEIKVLIGVLKRLQDNLGDHQDFVVQQEHLLVFGREMLGSGSAPVETFMAMGRLEAHLENLQQAAQAAFADEFSRFADEANRQRFAALFKNPSPPADHA